MEEILNKLGKKIHWFLTDGLCFIAEPSGVESVVPVTIFFSLAKNQDAPTITEVQFLNMSI